MLIPLPLHPVFFRALRPVLAVALSSMLLPSGPLGCAAPPPDDNGPSAPPPSGNRGAKDENPAESCIDEVAIGTSYACVRLSDETTWCWGRNDFGQLGDGTRLDRPTPVRIGGAAASLRRLTLSNRHSCGLADGRIQCWGQQEWGKLGNGVDDWEPVLEPVPVNSLARSALAVAAGASHSCGVLDDHSLWCWGDNRSGELGNAFHFIERMPVLLPVNADLRRILRLRTTYGRTCAIDEDRSLWCFGSWIALGTGATENTPAPGRVTGVGAGDRVDDVGLGFNHTCALGDGRVSCWGRNDFGQLGNGAEGAARVTELRPVPVAGLPPAVAEIATGTGHACARSVGGSLHCWGENIFGQLGIYPGRDSSRPIELFASDVRRVFAGGAVTCVEKESALGHLFCWGGRDGMREPPVRVELPCPSRTRHGAP